MKALNPNHPVTMEMDEQWYKLCAVLMFKFGVTEIQITSGDIEQFLATGKANITIHPKDHTITLKLVTDEEAVRMARSEGGLPV